MLHVNVGDRKGGAARSAYRLHEALLDEGIDSHFLSPRSTYPESKNLILSFYLEKYKFRLGEFFDYTFLRWISKRNSNLGVSSAGLVHRINNMNVDIVHLHWVTGLISISDIKAIKKPIVWTTHDSWPIQGIEYLPQENTSHGSLLRAISNFIIGEKIRIWKNSHLYFVAPSKWMYKRACKSLVAANSVIHHIPNALNFSDWKPFDRERSRSALKIPSESRVILMSAHHWSTDENKGMNLLIDALNILPALQESILFLVIGEVASIPKINKSTAITYRVMGNINSDEVIRQLISASDVVVVPSRCENYPNACLEALALGIPVVAFGGSGTVDMIEHKSNGWISKPYDVNDFSMGIHWALNDFQKIHAMQLCRDEVWKMSNDSLVAKKHISLYQKIVSIYPMTLSQVNNE